MDAFEFYSKLPRSAPGATDFTSAYLSTVQIRSSDTILDLHARSGERAVWVSRSRCAKVVCVDEDERYCDEIRSRARDGGSATLVDVRHGNYLDLPFADGAFSLIIAEWAATRTGFEKGLRAWRRLVPPNGYIAVSYPGVINRDAPQEVRGPLERRMVEPMKTLGEYHRVVKEAGLEIVHQAPLPHSVWENFYADAVRRAWTISGTNDQRIITTPFAVPGNDTVDGGKTVQTTGDIIREVLEEAHWYRNVGRGRVFLQSMLMRRVD